MSLMDKMMAVMMGRMNQAEKEAMMSRMMDKFLADMTAEDKQKLMAEMMPKMMEGVNMMEMMPQMMMNMMGGKEGGGMMGMMPDMEGSAKGMQMPMMPQMMMEMMPRCLSVMLPNIPKDQRIEFVMKMVTALIEHGSSGFTDTEQEAFIQKVTTSINGA